MNRVRKGAKYRFVRGGWDAVHPHPHFNYPPDETIVRVCQPHGCPPNGTMGHCFIEHLDGEFIGLVDMASLLPLRKGVVPNGWKHL